MNKSLIFFLLVILSYSSHSQNFSNTKIELFKDEAGRPEFSFDGTKLAYHAKDGKTYYDIYISDSNGENEQCLTCDHPELPNKHIGQPSWHPNGEWIVFQAEKEKHVLPKIGALAAPGIGYHNDVYIINLKTNKVFQLTDLKTKMYIGDKTPSCGILQPHFSEGGNKISWSQRYEDGGDWGKWKIIVADFYIENNEPKIKNIKEYTPGQMKGYYESNDFLLGDSVLTICGNLEPNQTELGIDVYIFNTNNESYINLTNDPEFFDECPHPNHAKDKIAYLSTRGFEKGKNNRWWSWAKGEFWIMDINGENKIQITHFNTPGYSEYTGKRVIPAYIAWSKDDKTILLAVAVEYKKHKIKDQIWKLTYE
ncbi:MAG TPA: hypothetical protein DIU39_07740 [Flavobacteriales bacterium]|nr:hypothetical protein [Flavobacteriales bacterium]|tara:strand:+ start:31493 stop:32590 length:1098 start_codon:yes stop_codon:yes gene_type:complete